jgi:hypothetical protein
VAATPPPLVPPLIQFLNEFREEGDGGVLFSLAVWILSGEYSRRFQVVQSTSSVQAREGESSALGWRVLCGRVHGRVVCEHSAPMG